MTTKFDRVLISGRRFRTQTSQSSPTSFSHMKWTYVMYGQWDRQSLEKFLKKIIVNRIYNLHLEERLLNPDQLGFRLSDSCVDQLIAITYEIFEAFDCNPRLEVRSVFLDISKSFDKVWHEGLLLSSSLWVFLESYINFLKTIYQVVFKGLL